MLHCMPETSLRRIYFWHVLWQNFYFIFVTDLVYCNGSTCRVGLPTKQWVNWLSWQSSRFWYERSAIWIQSLANFYKEHIFSVKKTEMKKRGIFLGQKSNTEEGRRSLRVNVRNKVWSSIAMKRWNKAIWFAVENPMTSFTQSCFIFLM